MIYFTECLSDTGAKTTLQRLLLELTLDDESVERQWLKPPTPGTGIELRREIYVLYTLYT